MDEYEEAILFTFAELKSRLDRLEYILSGPKAQIDEKPKTIPDRIHQIEKTLQALGGKTSLLADAHELCRLWLPPLCWLKLTMHSEQAQRCPQTTRRLR